MRLRKLKIITDVVILICGSLVVLSLYFLRPGRPWLIGVLTISLLLMLGAVVDIVVQVCKKEVSRKPQPSRETMGIRQLILLDEQNKPVKQWEMTGRTSAVIGRRSEGQEEDVDIDLSDCEYGTFVDPCHAVLNFCLDSWYIEDLGSQNGVKVKKVEDGVCYKVLNRPCKISAGDILYIANTRLLLS